MQQGLSWPLPVLVRGPQLEHAPQFRCLHGYQDVFTDPACSLAQLVGQNLRAHTPQLAVSEDPLATFLQLVGPLIWVGVHVKVAKALGTGAPPVLPAHHSRPTEAHHDTR